MAKTKQTKEFKVAPEDAVIIEYTDKAAYHKAGERSTVHRYLAGKLERRVSQRSYRTRHNQPKANNHQRHPETSYNGNIGNVRNVHNVGKKTFLIFTSTISRHESPI